MLQHDALKFDLEVHFQNSPCSLRCSLLSGWTVPRQLTLPKQLLALMCMLPTQRVPDLRQEQIGTGAGTYVEVTVCGRPCEVVAA